MKLKHYASYTLLLSLCLSLFILPSCKKPHSDIGAILFKETRNKVFKDIETDIFIEKFKATFDKQKNTYRNPKFLAALYEENDFEPLILMRDLPQNKLKKAVLKISDASAHGLNPETFQAAKLDQLLAQVYNKKSVKTLDEAYQVLIDLELTAANAFTNYSNALQFGLVSHERFTLNTIRRRKDLIALVLCPFCQQRHYEIFRQHTAKRQRIPNLAKSP